MIQQTLYQAQEQRQEQIIAPHQIQSLAMLTAPFLEIHTLINQELETNPTLERLNSDGEQLAGDPIEDLCSPEELNDEVAALAAEKDEFLANLMQLEGTWRDYLPPEHAKSFSTGVDEEKRKYFFDSLTNRFTLSDSLLEQLRTNGCKGRMGELCELIIGSIWESGYLRTDLADLASISNATTDEMNAALQLVQSFDPPGVAARDLRECLLLQLEREGKNNSLSYKVVDKYLDEVGKNRIPEIGKALKISSASLYEVIYEIKKLHPRPGNIIASTSEHYVMPEVFIEKDADGNFLASSNKDQIPRLKISSRYLRIMEDPSTSEEVRSYIKEKILNGNLLIKSLSHRQSTIQRIAGKIVEYQKDFFNDGEEAMKPLTMSQVADEIGVHETTVSRAIANKYVQTPRGIFQLKHFFTSGFETADGESLSSISIRKKIQAIISEEDPAHPISDQRIVRSLKEQGLKVARRTVAKYRDAMGIPSSHMRKNYG
jgi:RNA polymerase sigma-54 factor